MLQYHKLLRYILDNGRRKKSRARLLSTAKTVDTLQVFGYQTGYDLAAGFPLLTTKKLSFRAISHELIWFLRGDTNIKYLNDNGVTIWDEWADETGDLGPVYGKQWRSWSCPDGTAIDQIDNIIEGIKAVKDDPEASVGRRLIVTAWNPADVPKMAIPPCHILAQFDVTDGRLSCQLYQRSADAFLGVPFNIASYSLLTHLLAHLTGLKPGKFIHTFGDLHIYVNHLDQIHEQLTREPLKLPYISIDPNLTDLVSLAAEHIVLHDYQAYPTIKGEVAV